MPGTTGIVSVYKTLSVVSGSYTTVTSVLPGGPRIFNGYLRKISIRQTSGSATSLDTQFRYISSNGNTEWLAHEETLTLSGGSVTATPDAPFNCVSIVGKNITELDGNLTLAIQGDASGDLVVRMDFEVFKPTFGGQLRGSRNTPLGPDSW